MSGCRLSAFCLPLLLWCILLPNPVIAQVRTTTPPGNDDPALLAEKVIKAAGGREKLLTTFRLVERYNAGAEKAQPEKSQSRTSILQPPKVWTVGGKERGEEPAKFVVWAWTLGILDDPQTTREPIPGLEEAGVSTLAIRVSGTVRPAMDLHFDPSTLRLIRVDWRDDIYRFSDWREHDGAGFHAQTAIWKKKADKPWFFHEVVSVERLAALP
ncbi:MAG: hypothetical protein ACKO2P_13335 [Planctomycetota bacterium]